MAQILPELHDLFPDLPPPPDAASASARFQLFDSTATLLRNVAFKRPMLVVLDDLQAADTASILFLRFIASQLSDMTMMVVGTYRDVELTPEHPLTTAIAELAREPAARVLELGGLPADAVGEYLRSTTGLSPRDTVVAAVWRATNGNPLFVGEAVRLLTAEGRLTDEADLTALHIAVPQGVRAVIARRIGHLGDETVRALGLGAVLGPEFSVDVLLRIGDFESERLIDLIDGAVGSGLLVPIAGVRGRYRFSHDLVRETLYDELSPGRRARLHGRIATVIEELYAASIDAHRAELAFHFVQRPSFAGSSRTTRSTKASVRRRSRTRDGQATTRQCPSPTKRPLACIEWRSPCSTSTRSRTTRRASRFCSSWATTCHERATSMPPEPPSSTPPPSLVARAMAYDSRGRPSGSAVATGGPEPGEIFA